MSEGAKTKVSKTVNEGQPVQFDAFTVTVRRKRKHGGQYRVTIERVSESTIPIDRRRRAAQ